MNDTMNNSILILTDSYYVKKPKKGKNPKKGKKNPEKGKNPKKPSKSWFFSGVFFFGWFFSGWVF